MYFFPGCTHVHENVHIYNFFNGKCHAPFVACIGEFVSEGVVTTVDRKLSIFCFKTFDFLFK